MKKLNYQQMINYFNSIIFENEKSKLIEKLANNPDRYIGLFRVTKPYIKLIQNITQSHEIKFGNAFEKLVEEIFKLEGYNIKEKKIDKKNIDQVFEKNNTIVFIEQKIRDDHDSSKKSGQILNFEDKISIIKEKYPKKTIRAYFYFIDPNLQKNKNYYQNEIKRLREFYSIDIFLAYGKELFENEGIEKRWNDILMFLKNWKKQLPNLPELNFDKDTEKSFQEIKNIKISIFRKLFSNKEIIKEIFPIIFPQKLKGTLGELKKHFEKQNKEEYKKLSNLIEKVICEY